MEGERKKRKLESEEESEEQKMEKFFALIRSTKDVRNRLSKEKEDKIDDREKGKGVWNPKFQPEDFVDDEKLQRSHFSTTPAAGTSDKEIDVAEKQPEATAGAVAPPPAAPQTDDDKDKASETLDLTLSL